MNPSGKDFDQNTSAVLAFIQANARTKQDAVNGNT